MTSMLIAEFPNAVSIKIVIFLKSDRWNVYKKIISSLLIVSNSRRCLKLEFYFFFSSSLSFLLPCAHNVISFIIQRVRELIHEKLDEYYFRMSPSAVLFINSSSGYIRLKICPLQWTQWPKGLMQPLVKVNSTSNNLAVLDTILERNSQDSSKLNI